MPRSYSLSSVLSRSFQCDTKMSIYMKAMKQKKRRAVAPIKTLIVDDSPLIHASLGRFLGNLPYIQIVGRAANGMEALEQVGRRAPHLVVMDFQMPKMDGLQASRLIRERHPEVRIILMTAHDLARVKAGVLAEGPDAFLCKQDLPNELKATVTRLFPTVSIEARLAPGKTERVGMPSTNGSVVTNQAAKKLRIPVKFLDPASDLDGAETGKDRIAGA